MKMFLFALFAIFLNNFVSSLPIIDNTNNVVVIEVPIGNKTVLTCGSNNDDDFNFAYWRIEKTNKIIGPGNNDYDISKYRYEVLSGNLIVKAVSENDEGLYECVSRGIRSEKISSRSIKLILQKEFKWINENLILNNVQIGVIVMCALLIFAVLLYIIIKINLPFMYNFKLFLGKKYTFVGAAKPQQSVPEQQVNEVYQSTVTASKPITSALPQVHQTLPEIDRLLEP